MRRSSKLGTSATRRPAFATRMLISVSTSKPSQSTSRYGQAVAPEGVVAVAEVGVARAEEQVDERGQAAVAERRRRVMSALPPPCEEARALHDVGAGDQRPTKRGISAGSVEPSASSITMMSPVAAAKPACSAAPLPRRSSARRRCPASARGRPRPCRRCERPSTRSPRAGHAGIRENTCGRFAASLSVGMTTLTVGVDAAARRRATRRRQAPRRGSRLPCCVRSIVSHAARLPRRRIPTSAPVALLRFHRNSSSSA